VHDSQSLSLVKANVTITRGQCDQRMNVAVHSAIGQYDDHPHL